LNQIYTQTSDCNKSAFIGSIEMWMEKDLSDICLIKGRVGWKGYTVSDLCDHGPLTLGAENISNDNKLDLTKKTHLSLEKYIESPEIFAEIGDILIVQRGSLGKVALIDTNIGDATINPSMILIKNIKINKKYLYYYLCSQKIQKIIKELSSQTGVPMISQSQVKSFRISFPNLPEQHKIAAILSSMDAVIEQTDAIIVQTERMKKGLMQELFMKGIGHTEFKETAVGVIPVGWDVIKIENLVMETEQVNPQRRLDWRFKYIDVSSISRDSLNIESFKEYTGKNAPSRAKKLIKTGDIIFSTVRPYLKQVSLIPDGFDGQVCSTAFCVIRCRPDIADSKFLFQCVTREYFIQKVSILQSGSNYPAITDKDILCQPIPYPPFSEQRKIAAILSSVDEKIDAEREHRARLKAVKRSLMQDLLTGRIKVKVDGHA